MTEINAKRFYVRRRKRKERKQARIKKKKRGGGGGGGRGMTQKRKEKRQTNLQLSDTFSPREATQTASKSGAKVHNCDSDLKMTRVGSSQRPTRDGQSSGRLSTALRDCRVAWLLSVPATGDQ